MEVIELSDACDDDAPPPAAAERPGLELWLTEPHAGLPDVLASYEPICLGREGSGAADRTLELPDPDGLAVVSGRHVLLRGTVDGVEVRSLGSNGTRATRPGQEGTSERLPNDEWVTLPVGTTLTFGPVWLDKKDTANRRRNPFVYAVTHAVPPRPIAEPAAASASALGKRRASATADSSKRYTIDLTGSPSGAPSSDDTPAELLGRLREVEAEHEEELRKIDEFSEEEMEKLKRKDHHEYLMALARAPFKACTECGVLRVGTTRCRNPTCPSHATLRMAAPVHELYADFSPSAYDLYDAFGGTRPHAGNPSRLATLIDFARPCQSLRGHDEAAVKRLSVRISGVDSEFLACADHCFSTMIHREQERPDHHVFYHSYSDAALVYEVQAEVARALYNLPDAFPPLTRLLRGPYRAVTSLSELQRLFSTVHGTDHNLQYRSLVICASNSIFDDRHTEAPPLMCFQQGYSVGGEFSYRQLLGDLLRCLGLPAVHLTAVLDELVTIGTKFRLPMRQYGSDNLNHHAYGPASSTSTGHMLQIFVRKNASPSLAYASLPYGKPETSRGGLPMSIDEATGRTPACGQARLFMNPQAFVEGSDTETFHYSAIRDLCSTEEARDLTRGALILELRRALAPLLGTPAALLRTEAGVNTGIATGAREQTPAAMAGVTAAVMAGAASVAGAGVAAAVPTAVAAPTTAAFARCGRALGGSEGLSGPGDVLDGAACGVSSSCAAPEPHARHLGVGFELPDSEGQEEGHLELSQLSNTSSAG